MDKIEGGFQSIYLSSFRAELARLLPSPPSLPTERDVPVIEDHSKDVSKGERNTERHV
jgi:hypothetical protein